MTIIINQILEIPEDIASLIFVLLPNDQDIANFSLTCRDFHTIARDPHNTAANLIQRYTKAHAFSYILSSNSSINLTVGLIDSLSSQGAILSRYVAQRIQDDNAIIGKKKVEDIDQAIVVRILDYAKKMYNGLPEDKGNDWNDVSVKLEAFHNIGVAPSVLEKIRLKTHDENGEPLALEQLPICEGISQPLSEFVAKNNFLLSPFFELSATSTRPTTFTRTLIWITRDCPSVLDTLVSKGWHLKWLDQADFLVKIGRHHQDMRLPGDIVTEIGGIAITLLRKRILEFTPSAVRKLLAIASKEYIEKTDEPVVKDMVVKDMFNLLQRIEPALGFTVANVAQGLFKDAINNKDFGNDYSWKKIAELYKCDDAIKEAVTARFKVQNLNTSDPPPLPLLSSGFFDWILDRYYANGFVPQTLFDACMLNLVVMQVADPDLYNIRSSFAIVLNLFRAFLLKGIKIRSKHVDMFKTRAVDRYVVAMFLEAVWKHGVFMPMDGKVKRKPGDELMNEWFEEDEKGLVGEETKNQVFYETLKGLLITKSKSMNGR